MNIESTNLPNIHVIIDTLLQKIELEQPINILSIQSLVGNQPSAQCLLSLLAIHYNAIIEANDEFDEEKRQLAGCVQNNRFFVMDRILPLIGNMVSYPEPAKQMAKFEFEDFRDCCQRTGNQSLVRQSKGLYPEMNCDRFLIPSFVPYRENLHYFVCGNEDWQQARRILRIRYLTTKNIAEPIRLCYKILLGEPSLMEFQRQNVWNRVYSQLYLQFLEKGIGRILKYCDNRFDNENSKIKALEDNELFEFDYSDFKQELEARASTQENHLQKLILELIQLMLNGRNDSLIGILNEIASYKTDFVTMIALAMISKISKKLKKEAEVGICFNKFLEYLNRKGHCFDHFMKIFLKREEIVRYYTESQYIDLPHARFDKDIMTLISNKMLQQKPENILKVVRYLSGQQKLLKILKSGYLSLQVGSQLLTILVQDKNQNKKILSNTLNGYGIEKDYDYFIESWTSFHRAIQEDDLIKLVFLIQRQHFYTVEFEAIANYPQKLTENIYRILRAYSTILAVRIVEKRPVNSICRKVYRSQAFMGLLMRLSHQEIDEIWAILSAVLMRDCDLVHDILSSNS